MNELQEAIKELKDEFKFELSLEPKDELILYMVFEDGRQYTLQHPGTLTAVKLIYSQGVEACFEFFIKNCIRVREGVSDNKAKNITPENLEIHEAFDLWYPLAWRFLRFREKCAF